MLQAALRLLTPRDLLSGERRQVATTVRVKCTVTDRGRIINLKQVQCHPFSCDPLCSRLFSRWLFVWSAYMPPYQPCPSGRYNEPLSGELQTAAACRHGSPHSPPGLDLLHGPGLHWHCIHCWPRLGCSSPDWGLLHKTFCWHETCRGKPLVSSQRQIVNDQVCCTQDERRGQIPCWGRPRIVLLWPDSFNWSSASGGSLPKLWV